VSRFAQFFTQPNGIAVQIMRNGNARLSYFHPRPGRSFAGVPKIVKFSNDNEAIENAIPMANGADIEIWNLERRIVGCRATHRERSR
jgi:hypothetical protein